MPLSRTVGILSTITGTKERSLLDEMQSLATALGVEVSNNELLSERIAELELAIEDTGWDRISGTAEEMRFSREGLDKIIRQSRLYYLKNPIIRRPVDLQAYYVWGQGVSIRAEGAAEDVIRAFLEDPANESFNSHQGRMRQERTLTADGNLFLRFFIAPNSGRVKVRDIDVGEVRKIIKNPQDKDEVWFYQREWREQPSDPDKAPVDRKMLYPDWQYWRERMSEGEPNTRDGVAMEYYNGVRVDWDTPIMHVKTGTIANQDFGVPETYPALDWARAYKECLEDYKKVIRSLAKWAWNLKTGGTQPTVDAAIAKLQSTLGESASGLETNPAPTGGSVFVGGSGVDLRAVDVSKAAVDPEGFKRILLMAATSMGLSEIMYGDADVGNLATATAMDRPTELKFLDRQKVWTNVIKNVFAIVFDSAARAPGNTLLRSGGYDDARGVLKLVAPDGAPVSRLVTVDFPPILQRDPQQAVQALVTGVTMNGQPVQLGNDGPTLLRIFLTMLGIDDVEDTVEKFYPADGSEPDLKPLPVLGIDNAPSPGDDGADDAASDAPPADAASPTAQAEVALARSLDQLGAVLRESTRPSGVPNE